MDANELITAFVHEFDAPVPDLDRVASYFTEDAVYHNIPMAPVRGARAIKEALTPMLTSMPSAGWELLHQVASDHVVMNERIDRFTVGGRTIAIPVVGVFEVRDGKITAWRDYFDLAMFQKQLAG